MAIEKYLNLSISRTKFCHRQLATFFHMHADPQLEGRFEKADRRCLREYAYHLLKAGDAEAFSSLATNMCYLHAVSRHRLVFESCDYIHAALGMLEPGSPKWVNLYTFYCFLMRQVHVLSINKCLIAS